MNEQQWERLSTYPDNYSGSGISDTGSGNNSIIGSGEEYMDKTPFMPIMVVDSRKKCDRFNLPKSYTREK